MGGHVTQYSVLPLCTVSPIYRCILCIVKIRLCPVSRVLSPPPSCLPCPVCPVLSFPHLNYAPPPSTAADRLSSSGPHRTGGHPPAPCTTAPCTHTGLPPHSTAPTCPLPPALLTSLPPLRPALGDPIDLTLITTPTPGGRSPLRHTLFV